MCMHKIKLIRHCDKVYQNHFNTIYVSVPPINSDNHTLSTTKLLSKAIEEEYTAKQKNLAKEGQNCMKLF